MNRGQKQGEIGAWPEAIGYSHLVNYEAHMFGVLHQSELWVLELGVARAMVSICCGVRSPGQMCTLTLA